MIGIAVTLWVLALVGTAVLFVAVVGLQVLARAVRRVRPVQAVPLPRGALDPARRVAV